MNRAIAHLFHSSSHFETTPHLPPSLEHDFQMRKNVPEYCVRRKSADYVWGITVVVLLHTNSSQKFRPFELLFSIYQATHEFVTICIFLIRSTM